MADKAEAQDLTLISIKAVLAKLAVDSEMGLSDAELQKRLYKFGPNALPAEQKDLWSLCLGHFVSPIALMIEAAALVSLMLGDWLELAVIASLLLFNIGLEFYQECKATNALTALKDSLAPQATALRGGVYKTVDAATLVPGDLVKIRRGDIVPADVRLVEGNCVSIDQAIVTGGSMPVTIENGGIAYSGSVVRQGRMSAVVIATGSDTVFGRTIKLTAENDSTSHAQKAMFQVGNFLIILAVVLALIMVSVQIYTDIVVSENWGYADVLGILQFVLVLLVASIPVAMPAVFSITMALGALALSKEKAVVSRLSSIDAMAGADILCSDKTGTLTTNILTLWKPIVIGNASAEDVIFAGALASREQSGDAIDCAVLDALADRSVLKNYKIDKFMSFDPVLKRTEAAVSGPNGQVFRVAKGDPHAIIMLVQAAKTVADEVADHVADLNVKGYQVLAVARSDDDGKTWALLGILPMFDPPRDGAKSEIESVGTRGVEVKMFTDDDTAVAKETAKQLGLGTNILAAGDVFPKGMDPDNVPGPIADRILTADGFSRVLPEHKYAIVKTYQKRGRFVAMTGDGVNDAPALKQADCGIAVSGATGAARGASALILTATGLSVIQNAIDEARQIFGRITSYTVYRVALTMNIMFLVVLSTVFLGFQPVTLIMIVLISALDDIPIITVAYDNTSVSEQPIKWRMSRLMTIAAVLGIVSIAQSFGLLLVGMEVLSDPERWPAFGLIDQGHLQSVMFLQLVAGGHLLMLVCRKESWFMKRPYPTPPLIIAIILTQLVSASMCGFGILVPQIPWRLIGLVWLYLIVWLFIIGGVRVAIDYMMENRSARRAMLIEVINARLNG